MGKIILQPTASAPSSPGHHNTINSSHHWVWDAYAPVFQAIDLASTIYILLDKITQILTFQSTWNPPNLAPTKATNSLTKHSTQGRTYHHGRHHNSLFHLLPISHSQLPTQSLLATHWSSAYCCYLANKFCPPQLNLTNTKPKPKVWVFSAFIKSLSDNTINRSLFWQCVIQPLDPLHPLQAWEGGLVVAFWLVIQEHT